MTWHRIVKARLAGRRCGKRADKFADKETISVHLQQVGIYTSQPAQATLSGRHRSSSNKLIINLTSMTQMPNKYISKVSINKKILKVDMDYNGVHLKNKQTRHRITNAFAQKYFNPCV